MELKSKGLATSKWRIGVQKEAMMYGTYRTYNSTNTSRSLVAYSYNDTLTAGTTDIGTEYGYAGWVFEEVLSDRNDAAPPAPHNGTYASQGYFSGHYARDVAAGTLYPLYADKDGTATYWYSTYQGSLSRIGNFVTIKHNDGSGTLYAHLSQFANGYQVIEKTTNTKITTYAAYNPQYANSAKPSVNVRRGQIIGNVGATGSAQGSHIHLENYKNINQVFGSTSKDTWIYSPNYSSNVRDPKNYMKIWWK